MIQSQDVIRSSFNVFEPAFLGSNKKNFGFLRKRYGKIILKFV